MIGRRHVGGAHRVTVAAMTLAVVVSCGGGGPTQDEVAVALADTVVIPALDAAALAAATLDDAAAAYCTRPDVDALEAVRTAWSEARLAWRRTEAMSFGPRGTSRASSQIDHGEADPEAIEALLDTGEVPDADAVRQTLGARVRGLGAIEYLLFDTSADPADPDRCALLVALTGAVAAETADVAAAWTEPSGLDEPYRDVFTGESGSMSGRGSVGAVVEAIVFSLRGVSTYGVGRALGVSSPQPDPEAVSEGAAGQGGEDLAAIIAGIGDLYLGAESESGDTEVGLSDLVAPRSSEVDEAVRTRLASIPDLVAAVGVPFREGLAANPAEGEALLDALDELRVVFETNVVSLLDVMIGFSDTDGDSG